VTQAAKSLGVDPASLRGWLKQFPLDGAPPSDGAGSELRRLREEVRRLTMEREILKKATAFFAKESP
jgi:transposase